MKSSAQVAGAAIADGGNSSNRLLFAALDSFAEHGFEASTTRDIATRAGLSPAAVYVHYRRKVDLLYELTKMGHLSVIEKVDAAVREGGDDAPSKLRNFVDAFVKWHAESSTLARVAQYELTALSEEQLEEIRVLRRRFRDRLERIIKQGQDSGDFDVAKRRQTARAVLSLGIDLARWYRPGQGDSPEEISALYAELVFRMVRAGGRRR